MLCSLQISLCMAAGIYHALLALYTQKTQSCHLPMLGVLSHTAILSAMFLLTLSGHTSTQTKVGIRPCR